MLIGHSYGCYLVNRLASTEKTREKVSAVVLIGAGYPVAGYDRLRWIFYLPTFVSCFHFRDPSFLPFILLHGHSGEWASLPTWTWACKCVGPCSCQFTEPVKA